MNPKNEHSFMLHIKGCFKSIQYICLLYTEAHLFHVLTPWSVHMGYHGAVPPQWAFHGSEEVHIREPYQHSCKVHYTQNAPSQ